MGDWVFDSLDNINKEQNAAVWHLEGSWRNKTGIMLMLISEQILISGTAVATGFVFGKFGSLLFVPLLGLNYMSPVDLIPFTVTAQRTDVYRILGLMGGMLLICFTILSGIIIRQKIDRAVKLGEE